MNNDSTRERKTTATPQSQLCKGTEAFRGGLIFPGHPEYDDARRVWNAAIDLRRLLLLRGTGADYVPDLIE